MLRLSLALSLAVATPSSLADDNKLGNDKLKDKGYERLQGTSKFKPGCRYIIRSDDRQSVYHPSFLSPAEIGLNIKGNWISVALQHTAACPSARLPGEYPTQRHEKLPG